MWLFKKFTEKSKPIIRSEPLPTPLPIINTEPKPEPCPDSTDQVWPAKLGPPQCIGALPDDFWPVLAKLPYDFSSDDIPAIRKTREYKVLYNKWQTELAQNQVPAEHVASSSDSVAIEPLRLDCS